MKNEGVKNNHYFVRQHAGERPHASLLLHSERSHLLPSSLSLSLFSFLLSHCSLFISHFPFLIFLFSLFLFPLSLSAQEKFTDYLTRPSAGKGTVVLHQDAEIEALVNGLASRAATSSTRPASRPQVSDSLSAHSSSGNDESTPTHRIRTNGYRIQVYAGGNNRASKSEAHYMANLVRSNFSDVQVYTHFISPRWICRVGDFKTYEEANEFLRRMRQTQKFREASIVKSKIVISY